MKNNKKRHTKVLVSFLSTAALGLVLISNPVKADTVSSSTATSQTQAVDNEQSSSNLTVSPTDVQNNEKKTAENDATKDDVTDSVESTEQDTVKTAGTQKVKTTVTKTKSIAPKASKKKVDEEDQYSNTLKKVQKAVAKLDKSNKAVQAAKKTKTKKDDKKVNANFNRHITFKAVVKRARNKNYNVYKSISKKGKLGKKIANSIDFVNSHLESTEVYQGKKYRYWLLYVNGVRTGWVNENFFAKNKIMVPETVSLVKNIGTSFNTRNAISYATDKYGSEIGKWDVKVSTKYVDATNSGTTKVTYKAGKAKATVNFKVRESDEEGVTINDAPVKKGTNSLDSWSSYYGHSENYNSYKSYTPETTAHSFYTNGLTFTTKFYQPLYLDKGKKLSNPQINAVGHIPEGMVMSDGWLYTSLLAHTYSTSGHIVAYNLNELKDPYASQSMSLLSAKDFSNYSKNIKVSPYVYVGHGQGMGASKDYIYVVANEHGRKYAADSETLVQLRKSDLGINKIWTFKAWVGDATNPRYFHNATIVDDDTMYALYHDNKHKMYEYWMFKRSGSSWYPTEVGATAGNFVNNNAPVQGFAYDPVHENFYIAFNDLIVKVGRDGTYKKSYTFDTGREIEGISIYNNRLYVNLAQRPELLESTPLTD